MNAGRRALPAARVAAPANRNSLTKRSCNVFVGAFDPTLGRARIGADDVDVERVQGAAKLSHPITAKRTWMVDPEDPILVAVRTRPACPRPPDRRGPHGNRQRSTRSRQTADASAGS